MGEQGDPCTTEQCVAVADMQRFVARVAAAVHSHGSSMPVTLGAQRASSGAAGSTSGGARPPSSRRTMWMAERSTVSTCTTTLGWSRTTGIPAARLAPPPTGHHRTQPSHTAWVRLGASSASYNGLDRPTVFGEIPAVGSCCAVPMRQLQCASENNFWGMLFWPHASRSRDVDFSEHTPRLRSRR